MKIKYHLSSKRVKKIIKFNVYIREYEVFLFIYYFNCQFLSFGDYIFILFRVVGICEATHYVSFFFSMCTAQWVRFYCRTSHNVGACATNVFIITIHDNHGEE